MLSTNPCKHSFGPRRELHARLLEVMAADGDPLHKTLGKDPLA